MNNKYDISNLNEYLKTLNEKDEVRIALENLSKGNFKNAEKDVNIICYLFIQYNMMISNQSKLLDYYKNQVFRMDQTIAEHKGFIFSLKEENTKYKCNYRIITIVLLISIIIYAISLIFK